MGAVLLVQKTLTGVSLLSEKTIGTETYLEYVNRLKKRFHLFTVPSVQL